MERRESKRPFGGCSFPVETERRSVAWSACQRAEITPAELVDACLRRIDALNPLLRAVVTVDGEALFLVAGAAVSDIVDGVDRARSDPVQADELEPFTWALIERFLARGQDALPWARARFADAVRRYRQATAGYDVVLTPTLATEPWPLGTLSPVLPYDVLMHRLGETVGYTPIANLVGCPAMSVPLVQSDSGLPIGSHFAAAVGADGLLLRLAYQLEEARPWKDRWPPYSIPALDNRDY